MKIGSEIQQGVMYWSIYNGGGFDPRDSAYAKPYPVVRDKRKSVRPFHEGRGWGHDCSSSTILYDSEQEAEDAYYQLRIKELEEERNVINLQIEQLEEEWAKVEEDRAGKSGQTLQGGVSS